MYLHWYVIVKNEKQWTVINMPVIIIGVKKNVPVIICDSWIDHAIFSGKKLLAHDLWSPQSKQSPPGSFGWLTPIVKSQLI